MVTIILVKTQQALCLASPFFTVACKSIFSTRLLFPWLPLCCFLPLFGSLDALESLRLLFSLPSEPLAWELFLLHTLVWEALLSSLFLRSSVPSPFPRMPLELMYLQLLGFGAKPKLWMFCFFWELWQNWTDTFDSTQRDHSRTHTKAAQYIACVCSNSRKPEAEPAFWHLLLLVCWCSQHAIVGLSYLSELFLPAVFLWQLGLFYYFYLQYN